jgi:hypothetical protein
MSRSRLTVLAELFGLRRGSGGKPLPPEVPTEGFNDAPVFRPSPGRFFVGPETRGNREAVFDALRAPVAGVEELVMRLAAFLAASMPAPRELSHAESAHRAEFIMFAKLASIEVESFPVTIANLDHVLLRAHGYLVDPELGLWLKGDPPAVVSDRLWAGLPYSGLTLKWQPISPSWEASGPWGKLKSDDVYTMLSDINSVQNLNGSR